MPVKALDAGWPAGTPAGAIADAKALGASILMLYDADWSAPGANKTKEYLDAVDQGLPVIPICTPSNVPPATADQVLEIMVSQNLSHKFCMFDLEQYSFPSVIWMAGVVIVLHEAGWKVLGYGFQSTKDKYWICGFDYWIGVINYGQAYGYIPDWCDGLQYYDKLIGLSGATYDGSTISDALWADFRVDPPGPILDLTNAYGGSVVQQLGTPSGRVDLLLIGTDGSLCWTWGQGEADVVTHTTSSLGGGCRAISAIYWSDYSHIDVMAVGPNGTVWYNVLDVANAPKASGWTQANKGWICLVPAVVGGAQVTGTFSPQSEKTFAQLKAEKQHYITGEAA